MGTSAHTSDITYFPVTAHPQLAAYAIWDCSARSGAPARVVLLYLGAETGLSVDSSSLLFCLGSQLLHALFFRLDRSSAWRPSLLHSAGILPEIDLQPYLRLAAFKVVMTGPLQLYLRPRYVGLDHLPSHSIFSAHT